MFSCLPAKDPKYCANGKIGFYDKDVWHKATKLTKKLSEAAGLRGNDALRNWIPSIRNHFWHSSETCGGDVHKMKELWLNSLKHVTRNSECSHGPLEKLERNDWLEPETPPFLALTDVVTDKCFIDSFKYYANFEHTGDIEVYNSLQGVCSPKRVFFRYTSQKLHMRLSAIDFNHHVNVPQKTNEFGELLVSRRWSNFW